MTRSKTFPMLLEMFFTDRLMTQRRASAHTIASYRDTFRLLLHFIRELYGKQPSYVTLDDLAAPVICEFLDYLEQQRGNTSRSRNVRLAAIRSFFRYVAFEDLAHAELIQRVLAIPGKRWRRKLVSYLSAAEIEALLAAPNRNTPRGRRDYVLLCMGIQTGLRVSELIGLRCDDITFMRSTAFVRCIGKGRKERCIPLAKPTVKTIRQWLKENGSTPSAPLLPNAHGEELSRDGVAYILGKHVKTATKTCPSLRNKRISPHTLRHTNAMNLLQAGVDIASIALWLGHESVETTQVYLHADVAYKEKILARVDHGTGRSLRFRPDDELLAFLNNL
jgi:integrase/recombinase XerD